MKAHLFFSSLALIGSLGAKPFEGDLTLEVNSDGEKQELNVTTKGEKMVLRLPDLGGGFAIMDWGKETAMIVMPEQRMFMESPAAELAPSIPEIGSGQIEVTNETKEILGFTTRKVVYTDGSDTATLWMTPELGSFVMLGGVDTKGAPKEFRQAFPNGALAMEITSTDGKDSVTIRVVSVNPRNVAETEVQVPNGFSKLALPGGMSFPGMP